jgi:hypothetical protein
MQDLTAAFDVSGFAVTPEVLSEAQCSEVDTHAGALDLTGAGTRELLSQLWACDLAGQLRDCPFVRPLLGDARTAVQCTYFTKSPSRNWLVSFHQDLSIPVQEHVADAPCTGWSEKEGTWYCQPPLNVLSELVAVRVHLDDSTELNGPLRVVPGTHRLGRIAPEEALEHRRRIGEVSCTVARRGIVAMRPLLLHASSKSGADTPRRVLHFVFGPAQLRWGLRWRHAV